LAPFCFDILDVYFSRIVIETTMPRNEFFDIRQINKVDLEADIIQIGEDNILW